MITSGYCENNKYEKYRGNKNLTTAQIHGGTNQSEDDLAAKPHFFLIIVECTHTKPCEFKTPHFEAFRLRNTATEAYTVLPVVSLSTRSIETYFIQLMLSRSQGSKHL